MVARALISVSDKSGIVDFARVLADQGVEIVSTGGTATVLRQAGLDIRQVSDLTGMPEILDGRVKTLHPAIHGAILARRDHDADMRTLAAHDIAPIDLVVVNLYPFRQTLAALESGQADFADCIDMIDIGGPALLRAAAKNHHSITVIVEPDDYGAVIDSLKNGEQPSADLRLRLAAAAFAHVASYDAAIGTWLHQESGQTPPPRFILTGRKQQTLRYGENPHQEAALYAWDNTTAPQPGIATATCLQGKALSYNNINDAHAALALASELDEAACVIVKHANPCGVACHTDLATAFQNARAADPVSAFGGIIAFNRTLDEATAQALATMFAEVVIAPRIDPRARTLLAGKKDLRLLETGDTAPGGDMRTAPVITTVSGGFLVQSPDTATIGEADLDVVTKRTPDEREMSDLLFAWRVCKHTASNAIVCARDKATVGIGAGQMSRLDSADLAVRKAIANAKSTGEPDDNPCRNGVAASDAFFPFPDGLEVLAQAGITAVIQPGGSKRDADVIAHADTANIAMVFTDIRHFRH